MKVANEFFNKMLSEGYNFNKVKLGKVVEFDALKMKAKIQPLPSEEHSLLINVPVMSFITKDFYIRLPLKKDDIVVVLFSDNDLDNILLGSDNKETDRKHDLSDSICIGGIIPFTEEFTDDNEDDLIISHRENTAKIVIKENGDILVKTDENINFEAGKNIKLKASMDIFLEGLNILESASATIARNAGGSINDNAPIINLN